MRISPLACRPRSSVAEAEAGRLVAGIERRLAAPEPTFRDAAAHLGHVVHGEAEMLEDGRPRRRRAEVLDAHHRALLADPALPAEPDARLDAQPSADGRRH